jgi:hypothetical protein
MLLVSFIIIYCLKMFLKSIKVSDSRCEGDAPNESSALSDWFNYYHADHTSPLSGSLKCFCYELGKTEGFFGALFKEFTSDGHTSKICLR